MCLLKIKCIEHRTFKKVEKYFYTSPFWYPSGTSGGLITYAVIEYDFETEKIKSAQPSCMMLNITHRGKHCRLYGVNQKRRNTPLV